MYISLTFHAKSATDCIKWVDIVIHIAPKILTHKFFVFLQHGIGNQMGDIPIFEIFGISSPKIDPRQP